MTQAELEAFLAVVRCGTVSGAAQQLFITQPALSRRLGVLEEELGYPLLQRGRGRRSVELTAQGRAFVSVAEKWLTIWQEAKDLKKLNGTVTLRLESIVSVSTYLLGPVLRRFLQRAPDALTDEELLTLLLHAGTGAEEPRTLAARLIGQFGSLGAALSASPEELASVEGMDASRALLLRLVTELHRRYYLSRPFSGARLTGTTDFGNFLLPFFYGAREELVYLLALDAAGRLLTCTCLSEGSVNSANVPMRKLMRAALSANASGVVLAHNHPAGIALPSHEDVELTRRLQQALDVVDILLLDHLVIADDDFVSLRDSGYLR